MKEVLHKFHTPFGTEHQKWPIQMQQWADLSLIPRYTDSSTVVDRKSIPHSPSS